MGKGKKPKLTHTQSALILTTRSITHFLMYDKLLGFKGSASPLSHCTWKELFSIVAVLSTSRPISVVVVVVMSMLMGGTSSLVLLGCWFFGVGVTNHSLLTFLVVDRLVVQLVHFGYGVVFNSGSQQENNECLLYWSSSIMGIGLQNQITFQSFHRTLWQTCASEFDLFAMEKGLLCLFVLVLSMSHLQPRLSPFWEKTLIAIDIFVRRGASLFIFLGLVLNPDLLGGKSVFVARLAIPWWIAPPLEKSVCGPVSKFSNTGNLGLLLELPSGDERFPSIV